MGSSKNPPRKHHYIPRLLLRRFTDDQGILWVYDLEKMQIHPGRPGTAAFERDLYSRTKADGSSDHERIEKLLAETADGPGNRAISRLLKRETLPDAEWNDFLLFVAALNQRTPAAFERMTAQTKPVFQEMLERMARSEPRFREGVRRNALARGLAEEDVEKIISLTGSGGASSLSDLAGSG